MMARINHGFNHNGITNKELSSEIAFIALSISITTSTVKLRVQAFFFAKVKYKHGSLERSKSEKLLAVKPVQVGH